MLIYVRVGGGTGGPCIIGGPNWALAPFLAGHTSSIGQRSKLAQSVAEKRRCWTLDRHLELARGLAGRYCRRGREVLGGSPSSGRGKAVLVTVLVESADTMLTLPGATSALPHRAEPAFVPRDVWSTSIRNSVFVSECFRGQSSLSSPAKPGAKGHQGPEHRFRNLIRHCGVLSPPGIQPPPPDMV
ncbi:hypothetical protein HZH66_014554 [Vespula vulgaris]|uniref:Uncharacterized protein n=1 Tax=Vespula vulgaris TaxID=7454 RepID=A0A834J1M2_VESVU|nr:hypothetical protein HZH66_014554 [Vespula vulgaris]